MFYRQLFGTPDSSAPLLPSASSIADWQERLKDYNQGKRQRANLEKCKDFLHNFMQSPSHNEFRQTVQGTLYEHAFRYKGRLLSQSPILHIAIWLEATDPHYAGVTQMLLEHGADPEQGKATYYSGNFLVELHPLVIAAGMGTVHILEALTSSQNEAEIQELVNREDLCKSGGEYFYTPLHDACFLGRTSAAIWLLQHGADANAKDKINMTPLHLFVVAGNYDNIKSVDNVVKEFVKRGADLSQRVQMAGAFKARWGNNQFNPLEMATRHDANFPRDSMRFLAPSFECFQTQSGEELLAEVAEARQRTSFLADLIMLASKSPHAAEELSQNVLLLSKDPKTSRAISMQLNQDLQESQAVKQLVLLFTSSPPSATNILKAVTQCPFVQDPTHHPIRARTNLWGPFVNITMRCTYKPDAKVSDDGTLQPAWFNQATRHWFPSWHDTFAPHVDDVRHRSSAYDVSVYTVPVPDLLTLDVIQALSAVDTEIHGPIFAAKPIQGIVTCMWQTLGERVHYTQMFLSVQDLFALMSWGLTVGNDKAFSRLWSWSDDMDRDQKLDSPTFSPCSTAWLMGTCIKEAVGLFAWVCRVVSKRRSCRCWRRRRDEDVAGGWSLMWFLVQSGFSMQVGMLALLITLLWRATAHSDPKMDFDTQGLLALNVFARFWVLMTQVTKNRAIGPRIISILGSLMSGTMQEMIVVGMLIFSAFSCVFLVLRREHSPTWVVLYLYRGLIFGDGDGLDRFGVADESDALDSEGDPEQHDWSVFYGVVSTLVFGVAILNLIIAIYSDEYKAQQQKAPMVFVQKRALSCTETMIKYHTLGKWFPVSVQLRWFIFFLGVGGMAVVFLRSDEQDLPPTAGFSLSFCLAVLGGVAQLSFMVAQAHTVAIPCEKSIQDRGIPRRCCHTVRSWISRFGEHHSVSEKHKDDAPKRRTRWLEVKGAKLLSTHCLQVDVQAAFPKSELQDELCFKEVCQKAKLTWSTELRSDFLNQSDVLDVQWVSESDSRNEFKATLVFEPLLDLWRPFKLQFGSVSAAVRLPHFMWMCCRDDFDDVQKAQRGETLQLDNIQEEIAMLNKRLAAQEQAEKIEAPKPTLVSSQMPSPAAPPLGNRAIFRRSMSQLGQQPDIVGRTLSATSQTLQRTISPPAAAAVPRAESQPDSGTSAIMKEIQDDVKDLKNDMELQLAEQDKYMRSFQDFPTQFQTKMQEMKGDIDKLAKAVSSITTAAVPAPVPCPPVAAAAAAAPSSVPAQAGTGVIASVEVGGLAVSASSIDQEVDAAEEEEQGASSSAKKRRNRKKRGPTAGADEPAS